MGINDNGGAARSKEVSRAVRVTRLALFLLCPVYIVWSFKMGSGNIMAWPGAEIGAFAVLTLLWCAAWGFAALAHLRRLRMARRHMQSVAERDADGE